MVGESTSSMKSSVFTDKDSPEVFFGYDLIPSEPVDIVLLSPLLPLPIEPSCKLGILSFSQISGFEKKKAEMLAPEFSSCHRVEFPGWPRRMDVRKGN
jgi:hypothetical protein